MFTAAASLRCWVYPARQVDEHLRAPAKQARRETRRVERLTLAHDLARVAKLNGRRDLMQRNVGGAERGPKVVALLAKSVGRGPRLAEKLAHCDPVVLASNCDQRRQMQRAPCRQVLRIGGRQPGLQGPRCGHRDAGGLLDLTSPEEDVPKVIGAGRHQQRELRRLRGREGALGGDPGQLGLTHLGQRLGGDVVGLRQDAEGAAPSPVSSCAARWTSPMSREHSRPASS
jgi:hypothetical protein